MKKIAILFIFILISLICKSQTPSNVLMCPSISQIQSYTGSYNIAIVTDTLRGGTFNRVPKGNLSVDGGVIISSGNASYVWTRDVSQAAYVELDWYAPYVRNDTTFWDSAANNAINYLVNTFGYGTLFIPKGEWKTAQPIFLRDNITIKGVGEGSYLHNTVNNFFRGLTIAAGWFQQTDFGSVNVVTGFTDTNCQMYGMANYPKGQRYVTLLQDSSFDHLSVGNSIMVRKGFYPVPVGPGVVDSIGESNASEFLDIFRIDSLDRTNKRVYLDRPIPDSVWIYANTPDTAYRLHISRLIGGRPASSQYWDMPSSYMVYNATVSDLRVSSDSSSWTTRTATYKCTFKNIYVSYSKYGIGGNCFTQTLFENVHGNYRMRGIEHAEGGYGTIFKDVNLIKINPDPRPQREPTVVLQKNDQLLNSFFANGVTTESTALYLRGGAKIVGNTFIGRYTSFPLSFIGDYNYIGGNNTFTCLDSTVNTIINSGNTTIAGVATPVYCIGNIIENNTFNARLSGATGSNPIVGITGSDNVVRGNYFKTDTSNHFIVTAGVRNRVYNNFNNDTSQYSFSTLYPDNWFSANFYLGGNHVVDTSFWKRNSLTNTTSYLSPKNTNDTVHAFRLDVTNEIFNSSPNTYDGNAAFNPMVRIGSGELVRASGYQIEGRYSRFATSQTVGTTDKNIVLVEPTLSPDPDTLTLPTASSFKNKVLTLSIRSTTSNIWYLSGTWTSILATGGSFNSVQSGNQFVPTNLRLIWISDGTNWKLIDSTNTAASGSGGTVTAVTGTSPIASSGGTTPAISIANAAADGSTKGAASFNSTYFDASSGNISIDLTNGLASASQSGYLSLTDWNTFNNKGSGTVTSVGFTGGLISVGNPTTTPAFTVAGTSGGIPYFSSSSTWASSAVLAANALMIGGGAGVTPSTTTTGTGVLTWLGTPSSSNLIAVVTDETGSGSLVFGTSPTLTTPIINVGSDAANDIYYRNGSGAFTRLANGTTGQLLTATTGGAPSWTTVATGVTTVGTFSSSAISNGGSISGNTLTLAVGDNTTPGMISTTTQSIAGTKSFTGVVIINSTTAVARATNGGSNVSPVWLADITGSNTTAGALAIEADPTTNGLGYTAANGTRRIIRAVTGITNLGNTAGSESADYFISTQSAGTAASEKFRIGSTGLWSLSTTAGTAGQSPIVNSGATAMAWGMPVQLLSTTTGINAKTAASTTIYTVPAGKTLVVTRVVVRVTAATAITVGASASVTASTSGTIYASNAMTTLTATPQLFKFPDDGISVTAGAGETIAFVVGTGATGTSQTVSVDLIGYLF